MADQDLSVVFYDMTTIRAEGLTTQPDDARKFGMAPTRGPPLWNDFGAQAQGEGVMSEPDWDMQINCRRTTPKISAQCGERGMGWRRPPGAALCPCVAQRVACDDGGANSWAMRPTTEGQYAF